MARTANIIMRISQMNMVANEADSMANVPEVAAELKSLVTDFGSKVNNIKNH